MLLTLCSTFFQISRYSLSYTICIESYVVYSTLKYYNIDALHWIVAPQLGGGRQLNYFNQNKAGSHTNEQSIYSQYTMLETQLVLMKANSSK